MSAAVSYLRIAENLSGSIHRLVCQVHKEHVVWHVDGWYKCETVGDRAWRIWITYVMLSPHPLNLN